MNFTKNLFRISITSYFPYKSQNILKPRYGVCCQIKISNGFNFLNNQRTYSSNILALDQSTAKKRLSKKKKVLLKNDEKRIAAFSTCEEYNLESILANIPKLNDFQPSTFGTEYSSSVDVLHAVNNSSNQETCQDIFFFREGCVVMWNFSDSQITNILNFLKQYEDTSFSQEVIQNESEYMNYSFAENGNKTEVVNNFLILNPNDNLLEKYAVSNAMSLSVRLGSYEANLEQYITSMEDVTVDLKAGAKIKMSRAEVLRKTGLLFALRHNINLDSDLLDTPDFYWDRDELENLYNKIFNYFCIGKRTKVINEKINHCIELVELLSSHLNDKHHVRLEWMIIILIMIEVGFEILHIPDWYFTFQEAEKK